MSERIAAPSRIAGFSICIAAVIVVITALASPSPARAAVNLNVHVHDNYYHPAGAFLVAGVTDHTVAKATCQVADPPAACDAIIHVGDTITWVAPAPLAVNVHTVTECTDNTFTVCGPAVDPVNPIGDSGLRQPPSPGPSGWPYGAIQFDTAGTYYYRCEIHPAAMRGRIVVQPVPIVVGGNGQFVDPLAVAGPARGGSSPLLTAVAAAAAAGLVAMVALAGAALWARARWQSDDV